MKNLTKVLIGLLVGAGTLLQSDAVQHAIASAVIPLVASHPNVSAALAALAAILALIHNPQKS